MLDKINAENLNYIIGFLQTDGHHSEQTRNRGKIQIELNYKDKDILEKIQKILLPYINCTIKSRIRDTNFKKNSHQINLSIYDLVFRKAIKPYLPVGKKSNIIEPPFVLNTFSKKDYIRGLIDGDGSIGISKKNRAFISLCVSSEKIKNFILQDIEEITGLKKEINRNTRDNVYNIMLNNEEAIKYAEYLYKGSNLYLDRKYNEFLNFSMWSRNISRRKGILKKWTKEQDSIVLNNILSLQEKMQILQRTNKSVNARIWRLNNLKENKNEIFRNLMNYFSTKHEFIKILIIKYDIKKTQKIIDFLDEKNHGIEEKQIVNEWFKKRDLKNVMEYVFEKKKMFLK